MFERAPQPKEPLKSYGPSNWESRPLGMVAKIAKPTTPGHHDGELEQAMVDPMTAMKWQAEEALKNGEHSPDAWWGIWDKLSRDATKILHSDPEMKDWLKKHQDVIEDGVQRYGNIPDEVVKKFVSEKYSHPRLLNGSSEKMADMYGKYLSSYYQSPKEDALADNASRWDTVSYMLKLVAEYEDAKTRDTEV